MLHRRIAELGAQKQEMTLSGDMRCCPLWCRSRTNWNNARRGGFFEGSHRKSIGSHERTSWPARVGGRCGKAFTWYWGRRSWRSPGGRRCPRGHWASHQPRSTSVGRILERLLCKGLVRVYWPPVPGSPKALRGIDPPGDAHVNVLTEPMSRSLPSQPPGVTNGSDTTSGAPGKIRGSGTVHRQSVIRQQERWFLLGRDIASRTYRLLFTGHSEELQNYPGRRSPWDYPGYAVYARRWRS